MPSKEFDRSLTSMVSAGLSKVKEAASVRIRVECKDCGGYKNIFTSSSCPHPGANDGEEFEHDIKINLTASPPREKELPPPVERLDGQPTKRLIPKMKQPEERWKKPEGHEQETRKAPSESPKRTDGGKSRRDYMRLRGNDDPFIQAQMANTVDYEPNVGNKKTDIEIHGGDGLPHYSIGDK